MSKELTLEDFLKYTFHNVCGCPSTECEINELKNISNLEKFYKKEATLDCNIIIFEDEPRIEMVEQIIKLFVKSGLLKRKKKIYYLLNTNKRLTWNNIKMLTVADINDLKNKRDIYKLFNSNDTANNTDKDTGNKDTVDADILMYVKALYWYFRKVVVDCIISDAFLELKKKDNIRAMSVGSTSIRSDYDITLDGSYKKTAQVIKKFNNKMMDLFHDNTERLFDTNVYGVSFVKGEFSSVSTPTSSMPSTPIDDINKRIGDVFNQQVKCKGHVFSYINTDNIHFKTSQHIWALIKLLLKLNSIQKMDDNLYNLFSTELQNKFKNAYYLQAQNFINGNESNIEHYQESVKDIEKFLERNKKLSDTFSVGNFISFVNYNGSETYLTNGAFLDVVINTQMCRGEEIKLTDDDYVDSFIENVSEIITHYHKPKYISRALSSLSNIKNINEKTRRYAMNLLKQIKKIQAICSRNILKCQSFIIMDNCIKCIISVFNEYIKNTNIQSDDIDIFRKIQFKTFI